MKQIDKLSDNLPRTDAAIEQAFDNCQKEKRYIEKSRTFIEVSKDRYNDYLNSSLKALNAAKILLDNEHYEWSIVPAYSAMFQAGNALLIKELGRECRDHFCMLVSLLKLKKIDSKKINELAQIKNKLDKLSEESISFASKLRLVRSAVIYKPSQEYNEKEIATDVFNKARDFVNTIITILK